eukprot:TRINITY_DN6823_c0_g1_i1.p1 TRINITY_DN6823_c0_g1~~TRINITY_DN6823_c0_g1_i1.p1  ORF type:complete len:371 (-),score=55.85 TRINITY_DN6823_c0_g1_i1:994-2106(-)
MEFRFSSKTYMLAAFLIISLFIFSLFGGRRTSFNNEKEILDGDVLIGSLDELTSLQEQLQKAQELSRMRRAQLRELRELEQRSWHGQSQMLRVSIPLSLDKLRHEPRLAVFEDILLVVNFNWPNYDLIPLLKTLYGDFFPNIVFVGDPTESNITHPDVISVYHSNGRLMYNVVTQIAQMFPDFGGYLLLNDDVVLNFWNLGNFNQSKIWYTEQCWVVDFEEENMTYPNGYHLWDRDIGGSRARWKEKVFSEKDLDNLAVTTGSTSRWCGGFADIFYVPQRLLQDWYRLVQLWSPVHMEIAIPNIIRMMEAESEWEFLTGMYVWNDDRVRWKQLYSPELHDFFHAVKMSHSDDAEALSRIFTDKKKRFTTK